MKRRGLSILFVAVAGALLPFAPPASAATRTVQIATGNAYSPDQVFIFRGDSVTWQYSDGNGNRHSVTSRSDQDSFDSNPSCSALLGNCMDSPGQEYTHKFNKIGTFIYYCRVHGDAMTGQVVVREKPSTVSPSPSPTPTRTQTRSASPSPSVSPSPSALSSVSPSPGAPSGSESDGSGSGTKVAIAVILVALLTGAGIGVWRRFISVR